MTETKNAYSQGLDHGKAIIASWKQEATFRPIQHPRNEFFSTPPAERVAERHQYAEGVLTALRERKTVAQAIASAAGARKRCQEVNNVDWTIHWETELQSIEENELPSGAGIDNGTRIERDDTDDDKITLHTAFHHMNDGGMYDGWTYHTVVVTPAFEGLNVEIENDGSEQAEDVEGYLADVYREALNAEYEGYEG